MALISATRASTLNNVITHSFHPVESKNNTTQNTVTRYVPWYSWPTQLNHFLFLFTMDGGKVQMIDKINAGVGDWGIDYTGTCGKREFGKSLVSLSLPGRNLVT